jgi:peroxiredoxin
MLTLRALALPLFVASLTFAADPTAVNQAASLVEQKAGKAPKGQDLEFRLLAAQALQQRYPDLSRKFTNAALDELRANKELANPSVKRALTTLAPTEATAIFPPPPAPGGPRPPRPAAAPRATAAPELAAIQKRMGEIRGLPSDAGRAKLVLQIVADIRALPPAIAKLGPISSLGNLVTEGDLGKDALNAVASTIALALQETPGSASNYMELAKLVRYEHLTPPPANPSLDAATAVLALHDQLLQESGFSLAGLDGKTYNLDALRGKVVLLNFWATWCPPCRREMPDMETLYRRFGDKGLIVLAVSDEKRETVEEFLKKQTYTFPVLLDPDRKVNTAFGIEGIPNSFLFDRKGKLVAQSIDMRTERQFLEMFREAGLE